MLPDHYTKRAGLLVGLFDHVQILVMAHPTEVSHIFFTVGGNRSDGTFHPALRTASCNGSNDRRVSSTSRPSSSTLKSQRPRARDIPSRLSLVCMPSLPSLRRAAYFENRTPAQVHHGRLGLVVQTGTVTEHVQPVTFVADHEASTRLWCRPHISWSDGIAKGPMGACRSASHEDRSIPRSRRHQ
jgi:hypothetical protein